ncbi:MAG: hypothetical protein ACPL7B_04425 [Candidatus Poribacteria bacterium]
MIGDLYYAGNEEGKRKGEISEINYFLSKYVKDFLFPTLIKNGFEVEYLGVLDSLFKEND